LRTAGTFTVSGYIRFRGARPLVLLATNSITVLPEGTLDVSSFRNDVGAGGNTGECSAAIAGLPNLSLSLTAGAGGGGGAGFGTPGGNGAAPDGGAGGSTTALTQIRGGCKGASGGTSSSGAGGEGGNGGGAVYMIAGTSITIDGTVKANGAGGSGAPNKAGGGGGGSGGLIGLDAPALAISGTMFANGGGAGEGGGGNRYGENGNDPSVYDAGTAGAADTNGGGGGGGGAGRIKVFQAIVPTGKISPPAN
jgi:hypothetical protein